MSSFAPTRFDQFQIQNTLKSKYLELVDVTTGTFVLADDDVDKDQKWSFESGPLGVGYLITSVKSRLTSQVYTNITLTGLGVTSQTNATEWTISPDSSNESTIYSTSNYYISAKIVGDDVELSQAPSIILSAMKWKITPFSIALADSTKYTLANIGRPSTSAATPTQYQKLAWTMNQQDNGRYTILLDNGLYLNRQQNIVTGVWTVSSGATPAEWDVQGLNNTYTIRFNYIRSIGSGLVVDYILDIGPNDEPELDLLTPGSQPSASQTWSFSLVPIINPIINPIVDPNPIQDNNNNGYSGGDSYSGGGGGYNTLKTVDEMIYVIDENGMLHPHYTGNKITVPEDRSIGMSGFRQDDIFTDHPASSGVDDVDDYGLYMANAD